MIRPVWKYWSMEVSLWGHSKWEGKKTSRCRPDNSEPTWWNGSACKAWNEAPFFWKDRPLLQDDRFNSGVSTVVPVENNDRIPDAIYGCSSPHWRFRDGGFFGYHSIKNLDECPLGGPCHKKYAGWQSKDFYFRALMLTFNSRRGVLYPPIVAYVHSDSAFAPRYKVQRLFTVTAQ